MVHIMKVGSTWWASHDETVWAQGETIQGAEDELTASVREHGDGLVGTHKEGGVWYARHGEVPKVTAIGVTKAAAIEALVTHTPIPTPEPVPLPDEPPELENTPLPII